jgi:S1-C subfamily serine protease
MRDAAGRRQNAGMNTTTLTALSEQTAEAIAAIEPSVVQVHGHRRPVSGVAYASNIVLTTTRALGREDGVRVTTGDGRTAPAELAGWDPASGLAVLRSEGLELPPVQPTEAAVRVGQIALAVARSWSNALTASTGIVSVIGGPLPTGRGRKLEQIIRVTAPMHDGFAGGAVTNATGRLIGIATAAHIRGLAVVIPAPIAWRSAAHVLEHGRPRMGFLGVSGQPVRLPERQRPEDGRDRGLLVVGVTPGGPAEAGGVLIGDLILELDQQPVSSTDGLLGLLTGDRVGRAVTLRVLRGGALRDLAVTVGERPAS